MDPQAIEKLVEMSQFDIRQVINMLQMHKTTSNTLSNTEVHRKAYSIQKDWQLSHNAFSACSKFFNRKEFSCMQFKDKLGLFFID